MATEEYSIGYQEGYQDGWNAATEKTTPRQPEQAQPTESVLIDGKAYEIHPAVAAELLRLHMELLQPRQPEQAQPVAWPTTAAQISDMIGGNFIWREHKRSDLSPHVDDQYCLTAHDLLTALETWADTTPPPRQPLTDEEIWGAYMKAPVDIDCHVSDLHKFARAIEAAHGITGETFAGVGEYLNAPEVSPVICVIEPPTPEERAWDEAYGIRK